ncbi:MAG: hypothetical protein MHMPM18_001278 [Marteilia pararefringens]
MYANSQPDATIEIRSVSSSKMAAAVAARDQLEDLQSKLESLYEVRRSLVATADALNCATTRSEPRPTYDILRRQIVKIDSVLCYVANSISKIIISDHNKVESNDDHEASNADRIIDQCISNNRESLKIIKEFDLHMKFKENVDLSVAKRIIRLTVDNFDESVNN